jgi:hypothetical protein
MWMFKHDVVVKNIFLLWSWNIVVDLRYLCMNMSDVVRCCGVEQTDSAHTLFDVIGRAGAGSWGGITMLLGKTSWVGGGVPSPNLLVARAQPLLDVILYEIHLTRVYHLNSLLMWTYTMPRKAFTMLSTNSWHWPSVRHTVGLSQNCSIDNVVQTITRLE